MINPEQTQDLNTQINLVSKKLENKTYSSDVKSIHKALNQIHKDFDRLNDQEKCKTEMTRLKGLLKEKTIPPSFLERLLNLFSLYCLKKAPPTPKTVLETFEAYQKHRIKSAHTTVQNNLSGFTPASQVVILEHIQNLSNAEQINWSSNIDGSFKAALQRKKDNRSLNGDDDIIHLRLGVPLKNRPHI